MADDLRERIAAALLTVQLRLGPNSQAIATAGQLIRLSGGEADRMAYIALGVVRPELDRLHAERDRYRAAWRSARHRAQDLGEALVMALDETTLTQAHADYARVDAELTAAEQQRDGAYRERAQLLAWLAATHPAVLAPAPDVDEPGWQILYLTASGHQLSWHIHPRDAELFAHVEQVAAGDPRAQWDGHTTDEKYQHIRTLTEDGTE